MSKYEEKITDNSLWYTATPTPLTLTLPFYITEAGHFRAEADYKVERDEHDSYLLLCGKFAACAQYGYSVCTVWSVYSV